MSGSGGGVGYSYQAKATAYVAAHILTQQRLGWIEHGTPDIPTVVEAETGGPGDDLCVMLQDGTQIELQAKHGLNKTKLWEPLIKLGRGIQENPQLYGILLIDSTASGKIKADLLNDFRRLGLGRTDGLKAITQEVQKKFAEVNLPEADQDFFRRLVIVVLDLEDSLQDGKQANLLLSQVLSNSNISISAWDSLCQEGLNLIKDRGRRDAKAWARLLSNRGIELTSVYSILNGVRTAEEREYLEAIKKRYQYWWQDSARFIKEINQNTWHSFQLSVETANSEDESADSLGQEKNKPKTIRLPILDALKPVLYERTKAKILIIGKPGAGKSTLLNQAMLLAAEHALQDSEAPIPVLVRLKSYKQCSNIFDLVSQAFGRYNFLVGQSDQEKQIYIEKLIKNERLLLFVDGINEASKEASNALKEFCDRTLPVILTTRNFNVVNLNVDKEFEIQPLRPEDIQKFFSNRLPNQLNRVKELCDRVRDFGQTPLMVWMLYTVFKKTSKIPTTRGVIYREFANLYASEKDIDENIARSELGRLAFEMIDSEQPLYESQIQNKDLLNSYLLQPDNGIVGSRQVEFCHPTLKEYFAAEYLLPKIDELIDRETGQVYSAFQKDYLNQIKWTETIALMLSFFEITELQAKKIVRSALDVDLMLGAKLSGNIYPDWQEKTSLYLIEKTNNQVTSQVCAIRLLGKTCSAYAVSFLTKKLVSEENQELIFEIAFALSNISNRSVIKHLKPLLREKNDLLVIVAAFALGKIAHPDTLEDLRALLKHPNSAVREQAIEALGALGNDAVLTDLQEAIQDPSNAVRTKAVEALGELQDETSFSALLEIATAVHPISPSALYLRWAAAKALAKINCEKAKRELSQIVQCKDMEFEVRQHAVEALGELGESAIEELLIAINETAISWQAAEALKEIGNKKAVPGLVRALGNSIPCEQAAYVLGELGDSSAVPILIASLEHWYPQVREEAAEALGKIADTSVVPKLYELYEKEKNNSNSRFRTKLAIALGKLGDHRVIESLIELLARRCFDYILTRSDRYDLFEAIEKVADTSVVSALIGLLQTGNCQDRQQAVEALSKLRDENVLQNLIDALKDKDPVVRHRVVEALGKFDSQVILPKVFTLLQEDQDKDTRLIVYELLGCFKDQTAVKQLLEVLAEADDLDIHFTVIESLVNLSNPYVKPYIEDLEKALGYRFKESFLNSGSTYLLERLQSNLGFYNYDIFHGITPPGKTISVYFSYAPADEPLQTQLANHLTLLERQGVITSWSQRQILPGDESAQVINQQLNTANIILLLISASSLADDTCYTLEIQRAIERHQAGEARVIPILLRSVDWAGAPFSQLEVLPRNHEPVTSSHWASQDEAFREIAEGIRAVAMEVRRTEHPS